MRILWCADRGPTKVCRSDSHAARTAAVLHHAATGRLGSQAMALIEMVRSKRSQTFRAARSHTGRVSTLLDLRHKHDNGLPGPARRVLLRDRNILRSRRAGKSGAAHATSQTHSLVFRVRHSNGFVRRCFDPGDTLITLRSSRGPGAVGLAGIEAIRSGVSVGVQGAALSG